MRAVAGECLQVNLQNLLINKSSVDVEPIFGAVSSATAQWKGRGKGGWKALGNSIPFVPVLGLNYPVVVDLCAAGIVDTNAVTLNASMTVRVINSKKGGYLTSRCDDDLSTEYVNETVINIDGVDFYSLCYDQ